MSFKAQIKMMGQLSFKDAGMKRFATHKEAEFYAGQAYNKAIMAVAYQVVECDDPATHTFNWRQRTCEEIL
jgi:hypothetical protein